MTTKKLTKLLALYLPYLLLGLVATNFGEAWRLAEGKELGERIMSMMGTIPMAFANPLPSLHPRFENGTDFIAGVLSVPLVHDIQERGKVIVRGIGTVNIVVDSDEPNTL